MHTLADARQLTVADVLEGGPRRATVERERRGTVVLPALHGEAGPELDDLNQPDRHAVLAGTAQRAYRLIVDADNPSGTVSNRDACRRNDQRRSSSSPGR